MRSHARVTRIAAFFASRGLAPLVQTSLAMKTFRGLFIGVTLGVLAIVLGLVGGASSQSSPLTVVPSSGRVGIGTSSPAYHLDVNGTVNALTFRGDGSQLTNLPGASLWGSGGGSIWYPNGNVGVSTSAPMEAFQVGGSLSLRSFTSFSNVAHNAYFSNDYRYLHSGGASLMQMGDGAMLFYVTSPGTGGSVVSAFNERLRIDTGGTSVTGPFSASVKNFRIDHPDEPHAKVLHHSSLEGPEIAVFYRGEAALVDGEAIVVLPAYFERLTLREHRTVHLTPVGGWSPLFVSAGVRNGRFVVRTDGPNRTQRFYWEVKAVRADVAPLVVEDVKETRRGPKRQQDDRNS